MTDDTAFSILNQRSFGTSKDPITQWGEGIETEWSNLPTPVVASLYVHIPFCFHKCHYCDFYSIVDRQDRQEAFVARMTDELIAQSKAANHPHLDTIFIGGGTPTLLAPDHLKGLLGRIQSEFSVSPSTEWTIESNPETLTDDICAVLAESGVNRISMGAQSFNLDHLKALERHHDPESVERSIRRAKSFGFDRLSLDLIYGIPDQTLDQWADDLSRALALPIDHLSAYALTYEPNTAMTARLKRGEFNATPDELEVAMYNHTLEQIRSRGFARYEVSNHARTIADQSRHNLVYWLNGDWIGVGPGAHGRATVNNQRLALVAAKRPADYSATVQATGWGIAAQDTLSTEDVVMEAFSMGLRLRAGLDMAQLQARTGFVVPPDKLENLIEDGWLEKEQSILRVRPKGWALIDRLVLELLA